METSEAKAMACELFHTTSLTQAEIAKQVGRSPSMVSRWAQREQWGPRPGAAGKPPRKANFSRRRADLALATRMHEIILRNLDVMESEMKDGTLAPADVERRSKATAAMISGYGRVRANPDAGKTSKRGKTAKLVTTDDIERLQREIIERFERIQLRRLSQGGSE